MTGPTPGRLAKSGTEHGEQQALFCWASIAKAWHPCLEFMFAIPNGGFRLPAEAARFKAEGVKRGVPDICLPAPRGPYAGLFIEMKRAKPRGRLSPDQKRWIEYLRSNHYCVEIAFSYDEAKDAIIKYLNL